MDQPTTIPGDRTAAVCAYAAAAAGARGAVTLGAMYAVEVPRGGPYVFGTINDATGAAFNVLAIPVILQVHRRAPRAVWTEPMTWLTVSACAAGAASSALLVLRLLDFNTSTAVSVASITLQGAWFLAIHARLRRVEDYPRSLSGLGRAIGGGMLFGFALAAAGFSVERPAWLRTALMAAGAAAAGAAWLAWPYWYYRAGQYLGGRLRSGTVPAAGAQDGG